MSYVEHVLLNDEQVVYYGHVHWIMYYPGALCCAAALAVAKYVPQLVKTNEWFAWIGYELYAAIPFLFNAPTIAGILFTVGIGFLIWAYTICYSTEIAVTDRRVIAKWGVINTVTTEIDRRKIAGVIIAQGPFGKMMGYGTVVLRGYSNDISGLPPLSKPFEFQKYVNQRVRY